MNYEKEYFLTLLKYINYDDCLINNGVSRLLYIVKDISLDFSNQYNIEYEILLSYLSKWNNIFYEYNITLDYGWFINLDDLLLNKSIKPYSDWVPDDIILKYVKIKESY